MNRENSEELLQQMARGVVPVEDAQRAAARRERIVARLGTLQAEIQVRRARTRRFRRFAAPAASAAAVALGAGLAWHAHTHWRPTPPGAGVHAPADAALRVAAGTVLVRRAGSLEAKASPRNVSLSAHDEVLTQSDGRATVTLADGSKVRVSPLTELSVSSPEAAGWLHESVRLERGRIDVHVLPLPPGGSFVVLTPDASAEVHGTRFAVIVAKRDGVLSTRVEVREGHVLVRDASGQALLAPGASWTSHPPKNVRRVTDAKPAATVHTAPAGSAKGVAPASSAKSVAPAGSASPASSVVAQHSTLAEQNRIYQAAMDARRRGDDHGALALLDRLLASYPGSPLEQDARVERFRALERLGEKNAAARAARRYLAEYPNGFAREEARRVALEWSSASSPTPHK